MLHAQPVRQPQDRVGPLPVGAEGWDVAAGTTPLDAFARGVPRGALVDRLSMGRPSANGDFSGVIKNSFAIRDGEVGHALSETMISGNVAQMLRDVGAVSASASTSASGSCPGCGWKACTSRDAAAGCGGRLSDR